MIIDEKYINKSFFSQAILSVEGWGGPPGTDGLFRSTICVRNSETKKIEYFYGQIFLCKKDDTEQEKAIEAMCLAFEESDIYKSGKYDLQHPLTRAWRDGLAVQRASKEEENDR